MFTNRISGILKSTLSQAVSRPIEGRRRGIDARQSARVPNGFAQLPIQFVNQQQLDLYRHAYQAARAAAETKLLELLRARAGWN